MQQCRDSDSQHSPSPGGLELLGKQREGFAGGEGLHRAEGADATEPLGRGEGEQSFGPDRRAVIDVGTNSVKLLIGDIVEGSVRPVCEESEQTRLGRGFYESHMLQSKAIAETAAAVKDFTEKSRQRGAGGVRVIATSAARDAKNAADLITAIQQSSGLPLEIISGAQEADWAFKGVLSDPELAKSPLLILDVGGGSTEFILGEKGDQQFSRSFDLGTVRLLERFPVSDPPTEIEFSAMRQWLREFLNANVVPVLKHSLQQSDGRPVTLVGTGGSSSILGRIAGRLDTYDRERIESQRIGFEQLLEIRSRLWSLPIEERRSTVGLPKKRADVILTGVLIFETIMELLGFAQLRVSTRGLRYAALLE